MKAAVQQGLCVHACRVILEPLSSEVDSLLAAHNQEAVDNLVAYISAYISSNAAALPASNVMPLSGFTYPPPAACASVSQQQPLLEAGMSSDRVQAGGASRPGGHDSGALQVSGALQAYRKKHQVSSPFISLSGMHTAIGLFVRFKNAAL